MGPSILVFIFVVASVYGVPSIIDDCQCPPDAPYKAKYCGREIMEVYKKNNHKPFRKGCKENAIYTCGRSQGIWSIEEECPGKSCSKLSDDIARKYQLTSNDVQPTNRICVDEGGN